MSGSRLEASNHALTGELFAARTAARPQAVAVVTGDVQLSYQDVHDRARLVAARLRAAGVRRGDIVGVCLDRGPDLLPALYGIWRAGAAYLPLDPALPADRIGYMLTDAGAPLLVTQSAHLARTEGFTGTRLLLDTDETTEESDEPDIDEPAEATHPDQLAYVLYTSGSTGRPKGVMISHGALHNLLSSVHESIAPSRRATWLASTSVSFDISGLELHLPLTTGGRVVLASDAEAKDAAALIKLVDAHRVTHVQATPSGWRLLLAAGFDNYAVTALAGGEPVTVQLAADLQDKVQRLVNVYGPTETTIWSTYWEIPANAAAVSIGRPLANTGTYVLTEDLRRVPDGVTGQLHIDGHGLAHGYLGRPGLTAGTFVPNPYGPPGARLYRTGDLARVLPDGTLECLGRIDSQVKIRGYRIELGEIEAVLTAHPGVREAVVTVRETDAGEKSLVGYLVPADGGAAPEPSELRAHLATDLPEYMVPAAFVTIERVPLTNSGKVDHRALPAPDLAAFAAERYVAPRTPVEERLAAVWSQVLELPQVSAEDSFFELGGDSIRAVRLVGALREAGYDVSIPDVFEHRTVATLATHLDGRATGHSLIAAVAPFALIGDRDRERLPADVVDAYPLSQVQTGMLVEMLASADEHVYQNINSFRIPDAQPFSAEAMRAALATVAARHDILRTSVALTGYAQPLQLVHAHAAIPLSVHDIRELTKQQQAVLTTAFVDKEHATGFDMMNAPLLRVAVHVEADDAWRLTVGYQHAIADGWSLNSLLMELLDCYRILRDGGEPAPHARPSVRFADFIAAEQVSLSSESDQTFWQDVLDRHTPAAVPASWSDSSAEVRNHGLQVPYGDLEEGLRALAASARTSLKSVLLAAHLKVLGMVSGEESFHTGVVYHGRLEAPGADRVLGMHLNTLPFPVSRGTARTWRELVEGVYRQETEIWSHRRYPLPAIQRAAGNSRELLTILFEYLDFHQVDTDTVDTSATMGDGSNEFALTAIASGGAFSLLSSTDVVGRENLERLGGMYRSVLEAMAGDPDGDAGAVFLGEAERSLLDGWASGGRVERPTGTVLDLFEAQAATTPEAVAVVAGGVELSYREVDERANQVAHHLLSAGAVADSLVGVRLERGPELVPVLLGIWKAGAAYLPLDPTLPAERRAFILEDTRAQILVTDAASAFDGTTLLVNELVEGPTTAPARETDPAQLAYVIYTSGSTGRPKGVMIHHSGLANYLAWTVDTYASHGTGGAPLFSSISFDLGIPDLFTPLICGQAVTLLPDGIDTASLGAALAEAGPFSFVKLTPGHLDLLTHQLSAEQARDLAGVVIAAGDNFPVSLAERWQQLAGVDGTKVATEYGPTEITIGNSGLIIDSLPVTEAIPLGAPIPNTGMYVLTNDLRPTPIGVAGEVYIDGAGLARGYLGRPDLTAEKFLPNPHGPAGSRLYQTGDLARFLPDGTLETLGRIDNQVKIRGYRIELGEIEARLREHPHVRDAVVAVRTLGSGEKSLIAYLVLADGAVLDTATVREHLGAALPEYMVPTVYQPIDRIPLTANGKVDHRALPSPELDAFATEEYVAPAGPVEERLATVWSEVLGVRRVGSTDNFFALGGDSIRAVQVLAACREAGLSLAVWMILQATSLAELATMVTVEPGTDDIPLTPSQHHSLTTTADASRTVRLPLGAQAEPALLAGALDSAVRHHQALHTSLVPAVGPQPPVLRPATGAPTDLFRFLDLRTTAADGHAAAITAALDEARAALDPSRASTVRATLVRVDDRKPDELWLTVHALAADSGSFELLAEDLDSAYRQLASGEEPVLPTPATPWQLWAGQLAEQALSPELLDQGERWLARPPATALPTDRSDHPSAETATTVTVLPADLTAALLSDPQPAHPVLATLGRTLARWAGGDRIEIDVLTDPRHDPDLGPALSRTVGPLADTHPVSLRLPADRDTAATVAAVSRQLRALPAPVHGYGLLRHLGPDADLAAELAALPPAQVRFSWTPSNPVPATRNELILAPGHLAPDASPAHLLHVDTHVQDDHLYLRWTYRPAVHTAATVHRLADEQLAELSTHLRTTTAPTAPTARPTPRASSTAPTDPVPELMARHAVPGASIALLENGEVTSVRSYGVLGAEDPTPVTADTLFPAGSISKHVTTFLVLRLASEGVLDLDRDINEYLTSWQMPTSTTGTGTGNSTGPVTARLLLSNQSGLAPHPPLDDNYPRHEPFPTLLDVLNGRAPAKTPPVRRTDAPGEVFRLNPLNFSVLQQAMADATGTAFPELARHWLLEPLGMTASGFDPVFPDTTGRPFARGHAADGTPVPDGFVVHPEAAAGGLWTTAADLARLAAEIRRCYLGRPGGLVGQELVRRMLTPLGGRNYGWSTILDGTGADLEFGHGGQALGYQAMTGLRTRSGTGAVLLSNGAGGRELVRYLLATVWSGQRALGRLWQQAIDEATAREQGA
ncbi:amino acid adenylation domain-containing protein [Kitasatospora purpeofusca]|uniref:non-ribosomal peptide synthetase n=1 Tax=Kitasatospora purpeofusca TaxID=67352 RepID=UPI002E1678FA|nr:non-ribosomal peptide synthetase [Kitasatospora purpeofusca]WSR41978.1 amino acid adenylation domain-containing protein [Kitasatospora purpeofusca]